MSWGKGAGENGLTASCFSIDYSHLGNRPGLVVTVPLQFGGSEDGRGGDAVSSTGSVDQGRPPSGLARWSTDRFLVLLVSRSQAHSGIAAALAALAARERRDVASKDLAVGLGRLSDWSCWGPPRTVRGENEIGGGAISCTGSVDLSRHSAGLSRSSTHQSWL